MKQHIKNKELLVRKRMSAFLEKLLRYCGYDFRHDLYKQIIYAETEVRTPFEEKIKNLFDAYCYLLFNHKNPLTKDILKRFFYIIGGKETEQARLIRMSTKLFHLNNLPPLEKAIEYHLFVYSELDDFADDDRLIISLMFFNYVLVKGGIPTLRFLAPMLKKYEERRNRYFEGDKQPLYEFFLAQLQEAKFQDKSYYKKLKPLSFREIFETFLADKERLQKQYFVQSLGIFGSFAKGLQRFDSDIDLLVSFSQNISYEKKLQKVDELSAYYYDIFDRFVDFTEISEYVNDEIVKEITNYTKIF